MAIRDLVAADGEIPVLILNKEGLTHLTLTEELKGDRHFERQETQICF